MNRGLRRAVALTALLLGADANAAGSWIEHASQPGPDPAPTGTSRFDQLFASDGEYRLPYPFERLIETLENRIDNGMQSGVRQVFIPKGRSLQRDTPSPEHFRYPRRVIALEGEPLDETGRVLEYRLFIAHQPVTDSLEIISYNDAAGRFEFQLVENYGADRKPRVKPANRAMCLSCHQNAAPIFPRAPWSETSFNVEVSKRLVETLPRRFGSLIDVTTLDAGLIDLLSERANYLAAAQLVWRRGCDSARCRAAMLRAVLQYRLSSGTSFDWRAPGFQHDYAARLRQNWAALWPRGLSLASSRIPDRDPFAETLDTSGDPLRARPPHATWYEADPVLARGIILRLGGFFTRADIQRLDRFLIETADLGNTPVRSYGIDCREDSITPDTRILRCGENSPQQPYAEIHFEPNHALAPVPRIAQLRVAQDVNLLQPEVLDATRGAASLRLVPGHKQTGLSLRLASGNRIKSLLLLADEIGSPEFGRLEVELVADFENLDIALENMIEQQAAGIETGLETGVFERARLLPALMAELGMPALDWTDAGAPARVQDAGKIFTPDGELALLVPYCGGCHADPGPQPPGFLHSSATLDDLRQCAPRMLARLAAWRQRQRSTPVPMPPPATPGAAELARGEHYHSLMAALEKLAAGLASDKDWGAIEYGQLPPCELWFSE